MTEDALEMLGVKEYVCASCKRTFWEDPSWTDDEAEAEAKAHFTEEELENTCIVCDRCWNRIMGDKVKGAKP